MKKVISVILMLLMGLSILTGCGDPVADDFESFLNTDMVEVNALYEDVKTEVGKWEELSDEQAMVDSIEKTVLPKFNESLDKLSKIEPETDEVKAIKEKYVKTITTYKEGYEILLDACKTADTAKLEEGNAKLQEGLSFLDEYNAALEKLAKEKDMTIEY